MPLLFAHGINRFCHDVAHIILVGILLHSRQVAYHQYVGSGQNADKDFQAFKATPEPR